MLAKIAALVLLIVYSITSFADVIYIPPVAESAQNLIVSLGPVNTIALGAGIIILVLVAAYMRKNN